MTRTLPRRRILQGELVPGAPLPEADLARRYGASRPSVRDILLVRIVIEPEVVRRFGLPEKQRDRLTGQVERLEVTAAAEDWSGYAEADIAFHETVVAAAGSPRLGDTHGRATRQLRLHFISVDRGEDSPGPSRRHVGEHRRIADLWAADAREAAARLLTSHLEDARQALKAG